MRITWGAFYAFLYLYRCMFSVLGQTIVLRLTSVPDTANYQSQQVGTVLAQWGDFSQGSSLALQLQANLATMLIGAALSLVTGGSAILINIGFQTIAFLGLWRLLSAALPESRRVLAILVLFPSFTVWSSIASKEALVVFLVGMLGGYALDLYRGRARWHLFHLALVPALYVFKPQFLPALVFLLVVPMIARWVRQPAAVALLAGIVSLAPLYLLRHQIDDFVMKTVYGIFAEPGGSTRLEPFLTEPFDFLVKAPQGMLRAFIGPTFEEASRGALQLFSYAESLLIILFLVVYLVPRLPRMPAYMAIVGTFVAFWTLFANYPLGLANPGTAVRYRTDYILLLFVAVAALSSREMFLRWRTPPPRPQAHQLDVPGAPA